MQTGRLGLLATTGHVVSHAWAILWGLFRDPVGFYRGLHLCLVSMFRLGFRSTGGRISLRLIKSYRGPELPGCPLCQWTRKQREKLREQGLDPEQWLKAARPDAALLARFRATEWPAEAPTFTVLMPVYNTPAEWLRTAIASVRAQTYPRWELVCVNDASTSPHVAPILDEAAAEDTRVHVVRLPRNRGAAGAANAGLRQARGDYVCFLDHDDALEPQALHRFARAVLADQPDLLYSDEAVCGTELDDVRHIAANSQFSYDYYLSHPYFVHLIGVRATLAREVGGFDEHMAVSHDVDFVLRVLEQADTVSHIPEVLYRWRTSPNSLGHVGVDLVEALTTQAIRRHLGRLGVPGKVQPVCFNVHDVAFRPARGARVAIIIPTHNQAPLLRNCIESLERTVSSRLADIVVVDHQSDDPATLRYLHLLRTKHRVIRYEGAFNFSAMMNHAVERLEGSYTHYLFLNDDTQAMNAGWLEHMTGLACREDVGVVGAMLLYPDRTIQHAGVVLGLIGPAEHLAKFAPANQANGCRDPGYQCNLLANRDTSAVTGACLLIRAAVFEQVGGFDEKLAVGFGDTDLCLRVRTAGYKVLMDAHAVLLHHESASRGKAAHDSHPDDTRAFIGRWHRLIREGDPYYNPALSLLHNAIRLNALVQPSEEIAVRTTQVALPRVLAFAEQVRPAGGENRRLSHGRASKSIRAGSRS